MLYININNFSSEAIIYSKFKINRFNIFSLGTKNKKRQQKLLEILEVSSE